ncbi:MAG: FtsQ-type POTRA domain-containing protein [Alphaproteobacteria bacterium]|nr:FtsQ-type POTRA domain-containing protein [Alphaproteobacteria bacterium]
MAYAARLVMIAAAVVAAGILAVYAAVGRLDEAGGALMASFENRLTRSGYVVQWVDVTGADRLSAEEVAQIIGIAPGAGMAELDLADARAALEAEPWVGQAEIIRLWPDRIVVRVLEREPFALWQRDGEHRVIDRTGVVIEAADPVDFADLPRVTGVGADREASIIVTLLDAYPEIQARTTHALYVGERRWSLRLQSGGEVLLPADNPGGALAMLSAMHQARGVLDYDAQILDLRNDGEMVMRPWPDRVAEAAGRGA